MSQEEYTHGQEVFYTGFNDYNIKAKFLSYHNTRTSCHIQILEKSGYWQGVELVTVPISMISATSEKAKKFQVDWFDELILEIRKPGEGWITKAGTVDRDDMQKALEEVSKEYSDCEVRCITVHALGQMK